MSDAGERQEDDRIRCWALGVRVREEATFLLENVRAMAGMVSPSGTSSMAAGILETRRGVLKAQLEGISTLLDRSKGCGVEGNGDIGGVFANLESVVAAKRPTRVIRDAAQEFNDTLHEDAVYEITGRVEGGKSESTSEI